MNNQLGYIKFGEYTAFNEDSPAIAITQNGYIIGYLSYKQLEEMTKEETVENKAVRNRVTFPLSNLTNLGKVGNQNNNQP
jgi:hypothetical protein